MKSFPHISALLFDQPWVTTARALDSLIRRMEAAERMESVDLEAVATKLGRPLENTGNRVEMRDSVAVIDVTGPIFRYANIMTAISGATSVETLARDFQTAADNPLVSHILLNVDSPGGEIGGIADLADMIYTTSRNRKPVTAFIDGLGASAAYWLSSAAGKVYASNTAFAGSIGAVASITDRRGAQERQGVKTYTIVSSQSPRKVVDPATDEGQAAIQEMVDALGAIFVDTVARYRGVSSEKVLSDFGKGFVLPAHLAQKAGMIDGVTNFETLVASLQNHQQPLTAAIAAQENTMTDPNNTAAPAGGTGAQGPVGSAGTYTVAVGGTGTSVTIIDPGVAERERIRSILSLPEAEGREDLARTLAFEPGMTSEAAQRILASAPKPAAPTAPNLLAQQMARVPNPVVGTGSEPDSATQEAQRILSFLPSHQKVRIAQN